MADNHVNGPRPPLEEKRPLAGQPIDRLRQAGGNALDQAEEAARSVGEMANNALPAAGQAFGQAADSLTSAAGGRLKDLGSTMSRNTPRDGVLGSASQKFAQGMEAGGDYLSQRGLSGTISDVSELIRRNPVPAVLLGLGVGYLIGRLRGNRG